VPLLRVIGPGRAGTSLATALERAGWAVDGMLGRADDVVGAAAGVDLLVVATPDGAVAEVAAAVRPVPGTVVAHLAGSLGIDVLGGHERRAAVHPLVPLPDPVTGAARLASGCWFAVAGDPLAAEVVATLGGRAVVVAEERRTAYHAAACIAANHLVALLGQAERVAALAEVPFAAYLDLVRAAVDDVAALGPARALTGPMARGDLATVARHLAALPAGERPAYDVMANQARRLAAARPGAPAWS